MLENPSPRYCYRRRLIYFLSTIEHLQRETDHLLDKMSKYHCLHHTYLVFRCGAFLLCFSCYFSRISCGAPTRRPLNHDLVLRDHLVHVCQPIIESAYHRTSMFKNTLQVFEAMPKWKYCRQRCLRYTVAHSAAPSR